ncbi:pyridoxamine 5'-phosphate oxidase family protein [Salicibibacter halophilus]|uniref:Pyridoxamine 5'-phosphate oxidase family protein n=1 Tax=Salicibibacter halophilus TaxID=2502791 RepID=A0A514LGB7_9BACI|nr:pyridoxamine 5'-phosphate oxidase family protein [Salicibibacter halophilus]QDI90900.1 pyridoxamine 5'-phosphate oxidase family protein [Salicibibacter halophilus]
MDVIRDRSNSFNLDEFLQKPLFAHLSTVTKDNHPRESPVWFYWENECIWIIGTSSDSFPGRIKENAECAIGIIDFEHTTGKVFHAGFRGYATIEPFDKGIAERLLSRYLGSEEESWDSRFRDLDDSNILVRFVPETVVVRDQSYVPNI